MENKIPNSHTHTLKEKKHQFYSQSPGPSTLQFCLLELQLHQQSLALLHTCASRNPLSQTKIVFIFIWILDFSHRKCSTQLRTPWPQKEKNEIDHKFCIICHPNNNMFFYLLLLFYWHLTSFILTIRIITSPCTQYPLNLESFYDMRSFCHNCQYDFRKKAIN